MKLDELIYEMNEGLVIICDYPPFCTNHDCKLFGYFQSCYNHSHILCKQFEAYVNEKVVDIRE